jgi:urease accessory protein UreF
MHGQLQPAPASAADLAGDLAALIEQLGSPAGTASLGATAALLNCPRVASACSLRAFLEVYCTRVLVPLELPAILQAWQHASRLESRELIALDARLAAEPVLQPLARASRHAGRQQLRRLRPLRDHKLVQRYLAALDAGQAHGWHMLVFGLTLAVYSLSPRQGLMVFAQQTLAGFSRGAARRLNLSAAELASIVDIACAGVPAEVNRLVDAVPTPFLAATGTRVAITA